MRKLFVAILLILFTLTPALANNLILIPTGTTLTTGQLRGEAAISVDGSRSQYYWLGTGLQQFEANITRVQKPGVDAENIVGLQWCFIPETIFTPGVAFGVNDLADQTRQGVAAYAVISRRLPLGERAFLLRSFTATVGFGGFGIRGPFFGFHAGLPADLFVQGEFDSRDFNGAIGWQPNETFRLKAYSIRRENYLGAEFVPMTF